MKLALIAFALSGCAFASALTATQIQPMGPDTYMAAAGQAHAATRDAAAYCDRQGRRSLVTNVSERFDGATVVFRCLKAGDPELQRPSYQTPPAAVIEDRRR